MTATVLAYLPSPDQGVWHLGPVPVRAYALCILVGIVAALIIGDRRWTARGGEPGVIYDVALWAVPFGLLGGRMYHVITDWTTYFGADGKGFGAALRIWDGGLGIWGAVALGGVGAWIACRRRDIPLPAFGDAIAPGIVLAQAIGRLGNYFNQELYGKATTLPWGLEVYERRNAAGALDSLNGVSTGRLIEVVHPTFLYELLWNLLVFAVLIWVDRRFRIGHGRLFALYVAGYCVGRFWIELMRSDYATTIADTGIRVNTFTSTFVFIGAVVYIMLAPKGREDPATLKGRDYEESLLDEVGEELTAIAATSGVVAAAKVAGAEDEFESHESKSHETEPHESEAAAETEELTEEVATAPSEDIQDAEAFASAGAAADARAVTLDAESLEPDVADGDLEDVEDVEDIEDVDIDDEVAPEDGLGSVDGDEVAEAQCDVAQVHQAAVEGEREAESLAEDVAAEPPSVAEVDDEFDESAVALEGTEVAEALEAEPEVEPEPAAEDTAPAESAPEEGLGSVDGGEVAEAQGDVAQVHDAAVEGERVAESLAEDVAGEDVASGDVAAEGAEAEPESAEESAPEEGLGSVDGGEVAEAQGDVAQVHEAAVEGERDAESLAEDDATGDAAAGDVAAEGAEAEPESAEESAPEEGLGSVDGGEVAEAQGDVAQVHEAAVEGERDAESLAEDDATGDAAAGDVAAEGAEAEPESAEESAPEEGLGSVDGGEVAEAQGDVAQVHEAAVEGERDAESLAEDVAGEDDATEDATSENAADNSAAGTATRAPEPAPEEPRRKWWRRRNR